MAARKRQGAASKAKKKRTPDRRRRKAPSKKQSRPQRGAASGPFDASPALPTGVDPEKYPNLAALEAWDREMHIRSAMIMGLTRAQAERHVEEEMAGTVERDD